MLLSVHPGLGFSRDLQQSGSLHSQEAKVYIEMMQAIQLMCAEFNMNKKLEEMP
jgi:hypothetical protein